MPFRANTPAASSVLGTSIESSEITDSEIVAADLSAALTNDLVHISGTETITGAKTFSTAPVMSGASITSATVPEAAVSGLTAALAAKAADSAVVKLTGDQTVAGVKTFSSAPVMSGASTTGVVHDTGNETVAGIKTFSSAPVMSGASITSATVPEAAVSGLTAALAAKAADSAVVHNTGNETVAGIKTFSSAPVMSGASITSATVPEAAVSGLTAALAAKAADSAVVHNTGNETVAGIKTFSSAPVMSGASITSATVPSAALAQAVFNDLTTVTAVSTDYVAIADTSDSGNKKKALISDIVTLASSGGLSWTKYTKAYADFSTAATTNTITLATLAAGTVVHGVKLKHSTAFSGTSITAYTISVGTGTGDNSAVYSSAFNVFQAVADTTFQMSNTFSANAHAATWSLTATAASVGANLNAASGLGSVDIFVLTSVTP